MAVYWQFGLPMGGGLDISNGAAATGSKYELSRELDATNNRKAAGC
jgi:hypothetical protein